MRVRSSVLQPALECSEDVAALLAALVQALGPFLADAGQLFSKLLVIGIRQFHKRHAAGLELLDIGGFAFVGDLAAVLRRPVAGLSFGLQY